uniref:Uncharacterized protein n=1 Tax=Siphoviridae sp. ctXBp18 TaxID=2825541 RepID=A0A8S5PHZ2_9CAUD|nr:MAG TPA: hypothetical protein [Siphoviridae sp. ctXBp18]
MIAYSAKTYANVAMYYIAKLIQTVFRKTCAIIK